MKKLTILLTVLLMIIVTGCSNSNFTKLNYEELNKKLESKDTFILLFNDGSKSAELLKSTLEEVLIDNNLTASAYEINPTKLNETQKNALRPSISFQDASIVFIKDGIDPSILSHITDELTDKEEMESHLTNLGFIKKTSE